MPLQCVCTKHSWNQNGRLSEMPCNVGSYTKKTGTSSLVFYDATSVEDQIFCWEQLILRMK